jgi:hypothetical protein
VPLCPTHPGAESVGTCSRCGRFHCAAEQLEIDGQIYCGDCGARDDVDWLGRHYRQLEGRRSGVAWFLFVAGIPLAVTAVGLMLAPDMEWPQRVFGAGLLLVSVAAIASISGRPVTRKALVLASLLSTVLFTIATKEPWGALFGIPFVGVAAAAWTDVRTRLFFRVPVPRVELYRHYHREGSNPLAITASRLALLGMFVPGFGLLTLVLGVMAMARIDAKAVPPVGNRSAALGAIVFSLLTTAMWGLVIFGRT